jgi:thiamine biosynthesis lipoprotein
MERIIAACEAMATRFEAVLYGDNPVALRAAADEAFREIERLHAQLSLYSSSSEISFINAQAARQPVRVEPNLFRLLQLAQRIHQETDGRFDVTIAPLLRCWGFLGGTGKMPSREQIDEARARVGMQHVSLDPAHSTIRFAKPGMMIDLGSIGKGYALEVATELLLEAGVQRALIHGGTSTVCAIGTPPDAESWKIAIPRIPALGKGQGIAEQKLPLPADLPERPLAIISLQDEALSVSAVHGKSFTHQGRTFGHVIDPRSGTPGEAALLAAVVLPSATETDAFSTALLLAGVRGNQEIASLRANMRTLVLTADDTTGALQLAAKEIMLLD